MAGITISLSEERQNVDLHNYLVIHAKLVGEPMSYVDPSKGPIYVKTYDLNETGIVVKEDQFARVSEVRLVGSAKGVEGLVVLLNDFFP